MIRPIRISRTFAILSMLGLWSASIFFLSSCVDDLYASCVLDPASKDEAVAACGRNDGSARGCVVESGTSCETGTCGRFSGSNPFCTRSCTEDSECPDGKCMEFVFQTGEKYCVETTIVGE